MDDETLDRLAESFVSCWRQGQRPTIEEYAERHPELAAEIRALFPALVALEKAAPAEAAEPTLAGDLGEFRIVREIARGGMGVVYEAEQTTLRRRVALKVLPRRACRDPRLLDRFRREAQAAARLHHTNIVPVYGIGEHAGIHFYTMQFVHGQPLSQVIAELRRIRHGDAPSATGGIAWLSRPDDDRPFFHSVAKLGMQVAEALAYAHGQGVIHRDIKPSNLMLDTAGAVWVTDFGLARAEGADQLTRTGDLVGTLSYMAPERFRGWSDPRSDVYSLGLTLYELLSLRPAFFETDVNRLILRITESDLPPLRARKRNIPRDLETIILRATARYPTDRYQQAAELASDLGLFLADRPIRAQRVSAGRKVRAWVRRNPLATGLACLVAVLLVAGVLVSSSLAFLLRQERDGALGNLGRAVAAERQLREELRSTHVAQARALRGSRRPGRRFEALDQLARAARIRPSPEIRDEAIAALALIDIRPVRHWFGAAHDGWPEAVDPAHPRFARVERNGDITVRSLPAGDETLRLPVAGESTRLALFSSDGRRLAAISGAGPGAVARVWDLDRAALTAEEPSCGEPATVHFDEGGRAFVGAPDGGIVIVGPDTGARRRLPGAARGLTRLRVSPDGQRIAAVGEHSGGTTEIRILDGDGRQVAVLGFPDRVWDVAWHPRGDRLAIATGQEARIWDVAQARLVRVLQGHQSYVVAVAFDATGSLITSVGWDRKTVIWDAATGEQQLVLTHGSGQVGSFLFGILGNEAWVDEVVPSPCVRTYDEPTDANDVRGAQLSPDGRLLVTMTWDGVRVSDADHVREIAFLPVGEVVLAVFAGPDRLLTATQDRVLSWPIAHEEAAGLLRIGPPTLLHEEQAPEGEGPFPNDRDLRLLGTLREALGPGPLHFRESKARPIIAVSPDGRWAATNTWKGQEMQIWDLGTRECVRALPVYSGNAVFSPDGKYLAANGLYEPCRLFETGTWRQVKEIESEPTGIGFSQDGALLAITTLPSGVTLLDLATLEPLASFESPNGITPNGTGFGPDGDQLILMQPRRTLVWDLGALKEELARLGLDLGLPAARTPRARAAGTKPLRAEVSLGIAVPAGSDAGR